MATAHMRHDLFMASGRMALRCIVYNTFVSFLKKGNTFTDSSFKQMSLNVNKDSYLISNFMVLLAAHQL